MTSRGWGPWRKVWASPCSRHADFDPRCGLCGTGGWHRAWPLAIEAVVFWVAPRLWRRLFVLLLVSTVGCAALPVLAQLVQGAGWLATVVDVAEAGAEAYFARHPDLQREAEVEEAVGTARAATAALEAVARTAAAADAGDVATARSEALRAYAALRELLDRLGILTATPPAGGAETDAPLPQPLELPTVDDVAARL